MLALKLRSLKLQPSFRVKAQSISILQFAAIDKAAWRMLTEVETGPTIDGLFDGGLDRDDTFATLVDLITSPMPDAAESNLRGAELSAHHADAEQRLCGRFEALHAH
jgi:hypothetical protein